MNELKPRTQYDGVINRNFNYGTQQWVTWFDTYLYQWTDSRSGHGLKDWKEKIKRCESATTSFDGRKCTRETSNVEWEFYRVNNQGTFLSIEVKKGVPPFNQAIPLISESADSLADNIALKRVYGKLRDTRQHFAGGVFVGELRETLRMIKAPAKSLRTGLGNYMSKAEKRLKGVKPQRRREVLADTWLEANFGWKPAVNDLQEAVKAFKQALNSQTTERIASSGKREEYVIIDLDAPTAWGNCSFRSNRTDYSQFSVRYILGLRTTAMGASISSTSERLGFTLDQFAPTVWELLPWSFLADYFTNIGDIIESGAVATNDVQWINFTARNSVERTQVGRIDNELNKMWFGVNSYATGAPMWSRWVVTTVQRRPLLGLRWPHFKVKIPGSPVKWANMAALAVSQKRITNRYPGG